MTADDMNVFNLLSQLTVNSKKYSYIHMIITLAPVIQYYYDGAWGHRICA